MLIMRPQRQLMQRQQIRQQQRFFNGGCPCCGVTGCSQCGIAPTQYNVTISGTTNGSCSSCSGVDGTWTLTYTSGCDWAIPTRSLPTPCPPGLDWNLVLTYNAGISFWEVLLSNVSVAARWRLAGGSFNCTGSNTFTRTASDGTCTYPLTITVAPA